MSGLKSVLQKIDHLAYRDADVLPHRPFPGVAVLATRCDIRLPKLRPDRALADQSLRDSHIKAGATRPLLPWFTSPGRLQFAGRSSRSTRSWSWSSGDTAT